MSLDSAPQYVRPAEAATFNSNLAELVGIVAHKYSRSISSEASEYERLVHLFPNAFEHGIEIRIGRIETKLRHRDPEIEGIVTGAESPELRPGDPRPIIEQHDDGDASKCSVRNQHDKTIAPLGSQRGFVFVDLRSCQFGQAPAELSYEIAFEGAKKSSGIVQREPRH